jgi:hypothetical protein
MFEFNSFGLLSPPTIIKSMLKEFKRNFAIESPANVRRELYNKYEIYKDGIKKLCNKADLKQWVDGSFVTKKLNPADIDLVTFIDFETFKVVEEELKNYIYPASLINYGLDCYLIIVYPEGHKLHSVYKADCAYWINQFDKTKPDKRHKSMPKGFLEINV